MADTRHGDRGERMIPVKLMDSIKYTVESVRGSIKGRSADVSKDYYNTRVVAALSVMAGHGGTIEIGSYFGVSAIVASLAKWSEGITGSVYCVDPLDGREQCIKNQAQAFTDSFDLHSGCHWTAGTFLKNVSNFYNADVVLVQKPSQPFPEELAGMTFTVAFIDGDHWHGTPTLDWMSLKDIVTHYIAFDDTDKAHPHVMAAVEIASEDKRWKKIIAEGSITVFERIP